MVALSGPLTKETIAEAEAAMKSGVGDSGSLQLDLSNVTVVDSAGVAFLALWGRKLKAQGRDLKLVHPQQQVQDSLRLFPALDEPEIVKKERPGLFERLGGWGYDSYEVIMTYLVVTADAAWFALTGLFQRKGIRWGQVAYEASAMGSRAVGVVGLISFLVGATMALQSATQLRQFGANIFVVDLIGISLTRELGPLMAAIVVAGRSGSSVAAELGTMMITEEIDALKTMGIHPTRFLVVPKLIAISITQPLLTVMADACGIMGGFLVATLYLEVGPITFFERLQQSLMVKDLVTGLIKSVVFAQLIVTVGATCGYRTRGGADAVGRSTTMSVVAGIFCVIVADALASLLFYFGD